MTNDEFLDSIFGRHSDRFVFTSSVPGNPKTARYPYSGTTEPDRNNFFCVSTLQRTDDGIPRRTPKNFDALHVLVVDDVGTKIKDTLPTTTLGVPTYVIETSPKNYQWGYVLDTPVTNKEIAQGLVDAMCRTFSGDTAGLNRLVRLPVGINGKPEYGDPPPAVQLTSWSGTTYPAGFFSAALGALPVAEKKEESRPYLHPDEDPVVIKMSAMGLRWASKGGGVYDVRCPWVEEHGDARDDGAAYIAPAGFKCHHGHCSTRTFKDFRKWLRLTAKGIDKAIDKAATEKFLRHKPITATDVLDRRPGEIISDPVSSVKDFWETIRVEADRAAAEKGTGLTVEKSRRVKETLDKYEYGMPAAREVLADVFPMARKRHPLDEAIIEKFFPPHAIPKFLHDPTVKRFHSEGRLMTEEEGKDSFPRQWMFEDLVTANGMWLLAGQGGLGKSRLALVIAMSAATGLPFGEFKPANKDGVKTLFMTQEDDDAEKFHRYRTQLLFLQERDPRWKDPHILARLENNLFLPEIDPTEGLSEELQTELIAHQREEGAFGLVIWDPLILFWQGEEDAGLNSAQGARDTLNLLTRISRLPAKEQGVPYSVCFVHHLNKSGTVLGSVMVENLVRTVFKLAPDEAASRTDEMRARLIVDKSNGVALRGREAGIKLHKPHATVEMLGGFVTLTDEDRTVAALVSGEVKWDQPLKELKSDLADVLVELGATKTLRSAAVSRILKAWEYDSLPLELDLVGTGAKLRFKPDVKGG